MYHGKLTEEERKKQAESGACMYCGKKGHSVRECPKKKIIQNHSFYSANDSTPKPNMKLVPETISSKG
jgi:hypothetical protein